MNSLKLLLSGGSPALPYAGEILSRAGVEVVQEPSADTAVVLLPVPSFDDRGSIKGGGSLGSLLQGLPKNVLILGGNLNHPACQDYETVDFLQDSDYVAQNAAITAHCAIREATDRLPVTLAGQSVLVIGWGRIGKCLARLLRGLDARVTIAARKESDQAMAAALGYAAIDLREIQTRDYRLIYNTAPAPILPEEDSPEEDSPALKIDLASRKGMGGKDVVWARGLPGKDTPESSGALIARRVLSILKEKGYVL